MPLLKGDEDVRLVALSVLLTANLFANQVLAEDVSTQPLTRLDCARADMAWNDNVNVCGAASVAAEAVPEARGAQTVGDTAAQPLTREDCAKLDMVWNDNVNVCGAASVAAEAVPEARGAQTVGDTAAQPLTREDCAKLDMVWNDNVNVCGAASVAAEAVPEARGAQTVGIPQPNLLPERIALRPTWPGMTMSMSVEQRL